MTSQPKCHLTDRKSNLNSKNFYKSPPLHIFPNNLARKNTEVPSHSAISLHNDSRGNYIALKTSGIVRHTKSQRTQFIPLTLLPSNFKFSILKTILKTSFNYTISVS